MQIKSKLVKKLAGWCVAFPEQRQRLINQSKTPTKNVNSLQTGKTRTVRFNVPIRSATPERAKQKAEYNRTWPEWIKGKACRNCCVRNAQEVHHFAGRRGRLLLYIPLWVPLCSCCHRYITDHPKYAQSEGLTCPDGQLNNQSLVPK